MLRAAQDVVLVQRLPQKENGSDFQAALLVLCVKPAPNN